MAAMLLPESHRGQRRMGGAEGDTHRQVGTWAMGIASLHPSYGLAVGDDLREEITGDVEKDRRGNGYRVYQVHHPAVALDHVAPVLELGRAACRERVCTYV